MNSGRARFATYTILLSCLALTVGGCGSSDEARVVTRTVTEAATVEASPAPGGSATDKAWAGMVRRQNGQLTEVARRAQGATNSYEFWQISNEVISKAGYEIARTSTAGLSSCMADVPSNWQAVLTGFTIGGAAGTGESTLALRNRTLATVDACMSGSADPPGSAGVGYGDAADPDRVGGPATGRDVAGTSEQDKAAAEAACLRAGAGRSSFKCATWILERAGSDPAGYSALAEEWTMLGG